VCTEQTYQELIASFEPMHQEVMHMLSLKKFKLCPAPTKIKYLIDISTPKSATHMYWCKNHENPSIRKSHSWTPLKCIYIILVFGLHIWYQKYPLRAILEYKIHHSEYLVPRCICIALSQQEQTGGGGGGGRWQKHS
jgi:hypothetical protein